MRCTIVRILQNHREVVYRSFPDLTVTAALTVLCLVTQIEADLKNRFRGTSLDTYGRVPRAA